MRLLQYLACLLLMPSLLVAQSSPPPIDIDSNGEITIGDLLVGAWLAEHDVPWPPPPPDPAAPPPQPIPSPDQFAEALPLLGGGVLPDVVADCEFIRGDANADGEVNAADATAILAYLFQSGPISVLDSADVNDDGLLNISDPTFLLDFLFSGGPTVPAPYPYVGVDDTLDSIGLPCAQAIYELLLVSADQAIELYAPPALVRDRYYGGFIGNGLIDFAFVDPTTETLYCFESTYSSGAIQLSLIATISSVQRMVPLLRRPAGRDIVLLRGSGEIQISVPSELPAGDPLQEEFLQDEITDFLVLPTGFVALHEFSATTFVQQSLLYTTTFVSGGGATPVFAWPDAINGTIAVVFSSTVQPPYGEAGPVIEGEYGTELETILGIDPEGPPQDCCPVSVSFSPTYEPPALAVDTANSQLKLGLTKTEITSSVTHPGGGADAITVGYGKLALDYAFSVHGCYCTTSPPTPVVLTVGEGQSPPPNPEPTGYGSPMLSATPFQVWDTNQAPWYPYDPPVVIAQGPTGPETKEPSFEDHPGDNLAVSGVDISPLTEYTLSMSHTLLMSKSVDPVCLDGYTLIKGLFQLDIVEWEIDQKALSCKNAGAVVQGIISNAVAAASVFTVYDHSYDPTLKTYGCLFFDVDPSLDIDAWTQVNSDTTILTNPPAPEPPICDD